MKHTPEPWYIHSSTRSVQLRSSGLETPPGIGITVIGELGGFGTDHATNRANAERIVRCMNACMGIDPTALPEMLAAVKDYAGLFETFVMQDMEPEELKGELEPAVFADVMKKREALYALIAKAEGR